MRPGPAWILSFGAWAVMVTTGDGIATVGPYFTHGGAARVARRIEADPTLPQPVHTAMVQLNGVALDRPPTAWQLGLHAAIITVSLTGLCLLLTSR